ncbi:alkylmercury lyase family protein [Actinomadura sp. 3N407]|uniref:alkylmercury lyase family protein n=1 Tax=Actinomadura sp. 3N407 TaxID=3457423 RepID=UPI003FCC9BA1
MLELTVLAVPDCPNEPMLSDRLAQALTGKLNATITRHIIDTEAEAARLGMHGSPTLLINGVDPFAAPGTATGVSCRLYRDETGQAGGAPSVAALHDVLQRAADDPVPDVLAQAVGRAGLGRVAPVEGGLRAVHQRVLRAFAETGRAPSAAELDRAAAPHGTTGDQVLAHLHAEDFLRLDPDGAISAAYPFSAAPTVHRVHIAGGPQVYAMCAIDALGIAAMLGTDVTISSAEPGTAHPITVTVPVGTAADAAVWEPATAVVFYGRQGNGCETSPQTTADAGVPEAAADVCCGLINFFTGHDAAVRWARRHPGIGGRVLGRHEAWETGVRIFGPLLTAAD